MQITAEAMRAFQMELPQETAPGELPEAVLQLLPRNLYTGKAGLPSALLLLHWSEAAPLPPYYGCPVRSSLGALLNHLAR